MVNLILKKISMPWLFETKASNQSIVHKPRSASENDSDKSNSESWIISRQSSHVFRELEEIYPSAIRSGVTSQGQKYSHSAGI